MPTPDTTVPGGPVWVDLLSTDTDASRAFYGELFGWTADPGLEQFGGYFNFRRAGELIAGGMQAQSGMPDYARPNVWSVHLRSDDADKTCAAVAEHGGTVLSLLMAVGDLGVLAEVTDPGGAPVGIWQPGTHRGFAVVGEEGAPAWFELLTRDYARTVAFYRDAFGWTTATMSDTDEFRYTTLVNAAGDPQAGIMDASAFLPADAPVRWSVYFAVADADAAVAKVVELGGEEGRPPEDTPYGRIVEVADSTGASLRLVGPNKADPSVTPLA